MNIRYLFTGAAVAVMLGMALPVHAAGGADSAAAFVEQGPASYRLPVGAVSVIALSDGTVPQDLHQLLTHTTPANTDGLLHAAFLANPVEASINAFLILDGERRVLVDTGSGALFGPGNGGKLVGNLAAAGCKPDDITDILITHIHTDHSGGLVTDGRRTFPNATVHVSQADLDFFLDSSNAEKTGYARQYFDEAARTVGVYVKAGKVQAFADKESIVPGIVATLHPGHTPGSAFYTLTNGGQSLVFVGDIIHVAAVQFPDPQITIVYDVDPNAAAATRQAAFLSFASDRQLIAAPHLPYPGIGHVRAAAGGGFAWVPVEYRNRASH
jgi:glyoxylase-like metal-dependent hydrolase (beta-lactamase superfamily II)